MRILYNLQLSAIEKRTGKFLIEKDSNYSVFINTAKAFNLLSRATVSHYCLLPHADEIAGNINTYVKNVHYIGCKKTKRIFSSRYCWDADEMAKILQEVEPDVIWENNPTLVMNWKTLLLEMQLIDKVKVITYNHWVDSNEYPKIDRRCPYQIRQAEGLMYSDLYLVNSRFVKMQVVDAIVDCTNLQYMNQVVKKQGYPLLLDKIVPFPPLLDEAEIIAAGLEIRVKKSDETIRIIYNHRLSSLPYYNDAYTIFLASLEKLHEIMTGQFHHSVKAIVTFTDASGKLKSRKDIPFKDTDRIKIKLKKNMDRRQYLEELWKSDICVSTFRSNNGGGWSISLAEAILTNCKIVASRHSGYTEMLPEEFAGEIHNLTPEGVASAIHIAMKQNFNDAIRLNYTRKYNSENLIKDLYARLTK